MSKYIETIDKEKREKILMFLTGMVGGILVCCIIAIVMGGL